MSTRGNTGRRRWCVDLSGRKEREGLPSPPGYYPNLQALSEQQASPDSDKLVMKKSWDLALGPVKSTFMNVFLLYMSGSSISIFPIMMVGMMLMRSVKAVLATNSTFSSVEGPQAILLKIVFALGNLCQVFLALWKCQSLGLLPTHASDWLAFQEPQTRLEWGEGADWL